jgi:hypothetical protein
MLCLRQRMPDIDYMGQLLSVCCKQPHGVPCNRQACHCIPVSKQHRNLGIDPLHLLMLHQALDPHYGVMEAVAKLCCCWWQYGAAGKEALVSQTLPYVLVGVGTAPLGRRTCCSHVPTIWQPMP